MIVKVQFAIVNGGDGSGILVYNEDRSIMGELPVRTKRELKALQKEMHSGRCGEIYGGMKNYFYASIVDNVLLLGKRAPEQGW